MTTSTRTTCVPFPLCFCFTTHETRDAGKGYRGTPTAHPSALRAFFSLGTRASLGFRRAFFRKLFVRASVTGRSPDPRNGDSPRAFSDPRPPSDARVPPRTSPRRRPRPRPSPRRPPPRFTEASANDRGEGARTPSTASLPRKSTKNGLHVSRSREREIFWVEFSCAFSGRGENATFRSACESKSAEFRVFFLERKTRRSASSHHAVPLSLADL